MQTAAAFALSISLGLSAAAGYDALAEGAVLLDRPASAVAVLVGACDNGDGTISGECVENTKALKEKVAGKRVLLDLGAGYDKLLTFGGRNGAKTRFVWGPLYDVGNGLALTVGKPQKIAAGGNVVVQKRPVEGTSPDELTDLDLQRLAATGMVGIRIIGRFGSTWSMNGPDKTVKGVQFEVEALRLYNVRSGAVVFESTQRLK